MPQSMITSEIMWLLANSDKPLTAQEMEVVTDHSGCYPDAAKKLWRCGFLVRRKRRREGRGKNPYEYAITNREDTQQE